MALSSGMNLDGAERRRFDPTFTGSRQERRWIRDSLGGLFADRWFTDVLHRVQGGKEATVYCCRADPSTGLGLLAAKVFRPRVFRAMRNDALYKQGRGVMDHEGKLVRKSRSLKALRRGTRYGKRLNTISWVQHEYRALRELHAAGADVPRPLAADENAILMEFVGDESGPAPLLQSVALDRDEAERLLARLLEIVEIALGTYRIHGDLSAYNVMYLDGEIRVIDWPQSVDAVRHPEAYALLARDVDRLIRYFRRQGVDADPAGLAHDLWMRQFGGFADLLPEP